MPNQYTFQATYRGVAVAVTVEADGTRPDGVRLSAITSAIKYEIIVHPGDVIALARVLVVGAGETGKGI